MEPNPYQPSQVPVAEMQLEELPRSSISRRIVAVLCGLIGAFFTGLAVLIVGSIFFALAAGGTLGTPESVQVFFGAMFAGFICGTFGMALLLLSRDLWAGTQCYVKWAMLLLAPFLLVICAALVSALLFR